MDGTCEEILLQGGKIKKKRKKKTVLKIRKKEIKKKLLIRLQIVKKFEIGLNMRKHSLDGQ